MGAAGALVIGIGVPPRLAAVATFCRGRWSARSRSERAFLCVGLPTICAFVAYTGIKAAYLASVFTVTVAERNMIYAAPVLLVAAAVYFERRHVHPLALAAGAALALYLIVRTPYHMELHFYADAPGLSILQSSNRILAFTPHDAQLALFVVLAASAGVVVAARFTRGLVLQRVLAGTGAFVLLWCLTGEITGARASHEFADQLLANFPAPYNWVDRATKGAPTLYVSNGLNGDNNGLFLLEFWNRDIQGVVSLDGTTSDPRSGYAALTKTNGTLTLVQQSFAPDTSHPDYTYAVTAQGIELHGREVSQVEHLVGGQQSPWTLYALHGPPQLANTLQGVFPDGWFGKVRTYSKDTAAAAYTQFATPRNARGYLVVHVSRLGGGQNVPAHVRVKVGTVRLDPTAAGFNTPRLDKLLLQRTAYAKKNLDQTFVIDAPPAPFRAVVTAFPLFVPAELDPRQSDVRDLAGQVSFQFVPKRPVEIFGKQPDVTGLFPDGWSQHDVSYTQWNAPFDLPAKIAVTVSRANWLGQDVPSRVEVSVSSIVNRVVGGQVQAVPAGVYDRATWTVHSGRARTLTLSTPRPPFMVHVHVDKTFVPAELDPRSGDRRELGAQVGFKFIPY